MGKTQLAVRIFAQPRIAVIGFERVATGGDEFHNGVEILARQAGIRRRAPHFREQHIGVERRGTGCAQDMLGQHIQAAGLQPVAVQLARQHRIARGIAFQNLETVGRHQQRGAGLVQPVIGAADALHQPGRALWRADADDFVDRAPVDAQIQR